MTEIFIDPTIADIRRIYSSAIEAQNPTLIIKDLLNLHANAIYTAFTNGNSAIVFHLGSWSPDARGKKPEQIMALELGLTQIRESVAREYGFADWQAVENLKNKQLNKAFESAVEMVITGDIDALRDQLKLHPALAVQHSDYGHSATLLHYLGANGVESQRQITPMNCAEVAQCLIEHGANVNANANMYGGGSKVLGLVLSSAHPAKAGVTDELAKVLEDAGAI